jgi:hypothetical protein
LAQESPSSCMPDASVPRDSWRARQFGPPVPRGTEASGVGPGDGGSQTGEGQNLRCERRGGAARAKADDTGILVRLGLKREKFMHG